jgi:hypothetical protein
MLDPTYPLDKRKQFESMIAHIAQTGRAFGIHLILATQRPEETVIRPLIRGSINGRIAFATASIADSTLLVMNGDACFRDAVPPGRMVVSYGRHHVQARSSRRKSLIRSSRMPRRAKSRRAGARTTFTSRT